MREETIWSSGSHIEAWCKEGVMLCSEMESFMLLACIAAQKREDDA